MLKKIKISHRLKEKLKFFSIVVLISLFACIPYLGEGTIFAHDLSYHLSRIMNTAEEITNGNFPVFIHSNLLNGFGYGNPLFYPELFLYPAVVLFKLGMGILFSYKILIILATIVTFLTSFYAANYISKDKKISWITSCLYTFSLYRLVDIYVRGALGEVLAFMFLPILLVGLYDVLYGENKKWYLIPIALFCLINSHLLSFIMAVILILIICLVNIKKIIKNKIILKKLAVAAIVSLLLSMSFVVPYFEQTIDYDFNVEVHKNSAESLRDNAVDLKDVLGDEISSDGITVTKSIGILLIVLPVLMFFVKKDENEICYSFYKMIYAIGIVLLIVSTKLFPWINFECFGIIQFPYRLNIITTLLFSFVAGYSVMKVFENKEDAFKIIMILIFIISSKYIADVNVNPNSIDYEILMSGTLIGNGEYMPLGFDSSDDDVYSIYDFKTKIDYKKENSKLSFDYKKSDNEFKVHVPLTYYKGYKAYVIKDDVKTDDKIEVKRNELNSHLLLIGDSNIEGKIVVEYDMTIMQKIGYVISIMTLVLFINYIIYVEKIKIKE